MEKVIVTRVTDDGVELTGWLECRHVGGVWTLYDSRGKAIHVERTRGDAWQWFAGYCAGEKEW